MKLKQLVLLLIPLYLISIPALGQHENDKWYFGDKMGLNFTPVLTSPLANNKQSNNLASISDKSTGKLLFYTNGYRVWGADNSILKNGINIHATANGTNEAIASIIVPIPHSTSKYYIIYSHGHFINPPNDKGLYYATVDMAANNGKGEVVQTNKFISTDRPFMLNVIKHSFNGNYWLISHNKTASFKAHAITASGVEVNAVESGPFPQLGSSTASSNGFFISSTSNDGKKIVTCYSVGKATVFDFDKLCGTISNPIILATERPFWWASKWTAFSADNKKLYVFYTEFTGGINNPILAQYYGENFGQYDTVKNDAIAEYRDGRLGPDNRIYITDDPNYANQTHRVHVINNPNSSIDSIDLQIDKFTFPINSPSSISPDLPYFILDRSTPDTPHLDIKIDGVCIGQTTKFTVVGSLIPDSISWNFGDPSNSQNTSLATHPSIKYKDTGEYIVSIVWKKCGNTLYKKLKVNIHDFSSLNIGVDTSICFGDSISLSSNITGAKHKWSTGDTTTSIIVSKKGTYSLKVESGQCKAEDKVTIGILPPIFVDLGGSYSVCEYDTASFIQLDAGKGFAKYLWTPTEDTTRWIIVQEAGNYYVVVEDYRGCKGDDGTKIARTCDFEFYIPNAFTPNNDGLNDIFKPRALEVLDFKFSIYTNWGERIFATNNPQQGWDGIYKGKVCQQGVYLYVISFKGYSNKLLRNYNFKGTVSLIR